MNVAIIDSTQRDSLIGVLIAPSTYFNLDMLNVNDEYCIDEDSINLCDIQWLKDLPLIQYEPKQLPNL
jgi:hypothetical protein